MGNSIDEYMVASSSEEDCFDVARSLRDKNHRGRGQIYFITDSPIGLIYHAYFVPEGSNGEDIALNHADTGFEGYPRLTVNQVRDWGKVQDLNKIDDESG